ncbi:sulfurtransferase TusA family protein [Ramlibacter alkalitolerans]|uniref:Sulfurtransferase TusA family protein n=1 Tax=Ramlibacter alkalitolerans TaxID=2039631 RepID=A0ABS1JTF7_9BURK|nr:sulfurtransferase TusA family protein [Ramlibacter alkalitolerans]MBL0427522.1 sulfurtransferase TusA family protein [Ramlibacter alkalitolerans]
MSRLSHGEREFVSGSGKPSARPPQPTTAPVPPPRGAGLREIDARRLAAPLPLLEALRALRTLPAGEELRVITGYLGSLGEFQALAKYDLSFELVSQEAEGEKFVHLLRKRR